MQQLDPANDRIGQLFALPRRNIGGCFSPISGHSRLACVDNFPLK
jgi:hypothetical protein